ncbi:MAG TPA: GlsB/YeaQ/YmgE family stress response membrane protein [Rhizomicrobium sp.]|nr:GlsB/YeaQ/YmgE family stress response membrane protein [Rhizomicrobium sp.]
MSVLGWIFLGLLSGFIASKAVSGQGSGCLPDIALGLLGAVVGGGLFSLLGHHSPMEFSFTSLLISVIGAVIVLVIWHAITGRRGLH